MTIQVIPRGTLLFSTQKYKEKAEYIATQRIMTFENRHVGQKRKQSHNTILLNFTQYDHSLHNKTILVTYNSLTFLLRTKDTGHLTM